MTTSERYTRFDAADYLENLDDVAAYDEPVEVVIVGDPAEAGTRALLTAALRAFVPGRLVTGGAPMSRMN